MRRWDAGAGRIGALIIELDRPRRGASVAPTRLQTPVPTMANEVYRSANHSIHSATLADVLERVLDKGLVIAGDIKIKLVDIELLTIQIRLVVASVEKAREMGLDWWTTNSDFNSRPIPHDRQDELTALRNRISELEARLSPEAAKPLPVPLEAP